MTVAEMLSDVYADCGHPTSPQAEVTTRIRRNLNKGYRLIMADPVLSSGLRHNATPFLLTAEVGRGAYGISPQIARVTSISDPDTDRVLQQITLADIHRMDPGVTAGGPSWAWVDYGIKPFSRPISSSGGGLWVESSSASDTTQTIEINTVRSAAGTIEGVASGDLSSAALTGVTRLQIGALTDHVAIQSIRLSAVAVGIVSVYNAASGGSITAQIPIGQLSSQYRLIRLYPPPTAASVYHVDAEWKIVDLDDTADIPILPEEFHDLLPQYAKMLEYEIQREPVLLSRATEIYNQRLSQLKNRVNSTVVIGGSSYREHSRLGGYYPDDRFWR